MNNHFHKKCRKWRLFLGITEEEAAAKVGTNQASISKFETGKIKKLKDRKRHRRLERYYEGLRKKVANIMQE